MRNRKRNKIKQSDRAFNFLLLVILSIFLLIVLYPLIYIVSSSLSSGSAVTGGKVMLWPVDFSLTGYEIVFSNLRVWTGYANTIFYAVVGTLLNLVLTILVAYPLSRKDFHGRSVMTIIFMIPMFVGGGMIPTYILMSNLGLTNTRGAMLFAGALSIYNMVLMRTFFQNSIPIELLESAKMDGISDIGYLLRVVLPLSKAIISVITLYYMVSHWNSYMNPLIYLRDKELQPLQLVLREILYSTRVETSQIQDVGLISQLASATDTMKYALIVVSTVPMLVLYPFVQKFFEKGVMIGSVKG